MSKTISLYADLAALKMRLALAKLVLKYNPDQPRVSAGNRHGGQWTQGEVQLADDDAGSIATEAQAMRLKPDTGSHVVLPNGQMVPDQYSDTGYLVSPVSDLTPVANAGRQAGVTYQQMMNSPDPNIQQAALPQMMGSIGGALSHGGSFDYQRTRGNYFLNFIQLPQFRDVSNFNVGLYMQQTGQFSEDETLSLAGDFARYFSSNYMPDQPYGLDQRTAALIRVGYRTGQSGVFGKLPGR